MLAAIIIAAAAPARAGVAVLAGGGLAYGVAGAHAEVRFGFLAAFVGAGINLVSWSYDSPPAYAAGLKVLPFAGESGPVFSGHVTWSSGYHQGDPHTQEYAAFDATYFAATAGWRQRFESRLFLEFGVGLGISRSHDYGNSPSPGRQLSCTPPDQAANYCQLTHSVTGDVDLAIGYEF